MSLRSLRHAVRVVLVASALAGPGAGGAAAQPAITLQPVATGLANPVTIAHAGDGSGRLFIVLQGGRIVIFTGSQVLATPFLDITSLVLSGGERGLLGLAFHPSYAVNGFFYVYYTRQTDGAIVIARYQVSADPSVANPGSALVLLTVPHPGASNHNGGQLVFGPDGYLYAGLGDGGTGGANSQNLGTLLGKLIRLDVDAGAPYIPPTNPFVGVPGARGEIWALGLRNPWRFSFDRATGDLLIADVGQSSREEVDFQPAGSPGGQNYCWRRMEGTLLFDPATPCTTGVPTPPILEYDHSAGDCSIIGGSRYRGAQVPGLQGYYLYGDLCTGRIWAAAPGAGGIWTATQLLDTPHTISTFGEDQAGELYVAHLAATAGVVYRIVAVAPPVFTGGVFVAAGNLAGPGPAQIVTGAGVGGGARVRAFDGDGTPRATDFLVYPAGFTGGVRVAACDFDGDGRAEIVTAAGPTGGPHVRIIALDAAGVPAGDLANFFAYDPGMTAGLFVACGDVDGDGVPELILGVDAGGGPHVRVFKHQPGAPGGVAAFFDFFAYDPGFRGGIRVAAGNVDGSDRASLILGAGPGGGPHVRVLKWTGSALVELASFYAYVPGFRSGIFVAAGNVLGGPAAQIITSADAGGGPHVRVWTGTGADTGIGFFAYAPAFTGGVRVAAGDVNGTGAAEILTGAGPGGGPHVGIFSGTGVALGPGFFAY